MEPWKNLAEHPYWDIFQASFFLFFLAPGNEDIFKSGMATIDFYCSQVSTGI